MNFDNELSAEMEQLADCDNPHLLAQEIVVYQGLSLKQLLTAVRTGSIVMNVDRCKLRLAAIEAHYAAMLSYPTRMNIYGYTPKAIQKVYEWSREIQSELTAHYTYYNHTTPRSTSASSSNKQLVEQTKLFQTTTKE